MKKSKNKTPLFKTNSTSNFVFPELYLSALSRKSEASLGSLFTIVIYKA